MQNTGLALTLGHCKTKCCNSENIFPLRLAVKCCNILGLCTLKAVGGGGGGYILLSPFVGLTESAIFTLLLMLPVAICTIQPASTLKGVWENNKRQKDGGKEERGGGVTGLEKPA